MLPKKIYLREKDLHEHFSEERLVAIDEPYEDLNVEYINLNNTWHDAIEEPKMGKQVLGIDYDGMAGSGVFDFKSINGIFICNDLILGWNEVVRWAYIEDLLPKGGER